MRKIRLFIATSLDGYIARPDGNLDWLTSQPQPAQGDYGYQALIEDVDTLLMGRKTYEELLSFGEDWFYPEHDTYVFSRSADFQAKTPRTYAVDDAHAAGQIHALRNSPGKDIWLVGGGALIAKFLDEGWIEEMLITVVPIVLGEGIRLFPGGKRESNWKLAESKAFETGLVNLVYERQG